jgi:hypothetical protein
MNKMFAKIKTPEDFYKCHVSQILGLNERYLGGECCVPCCGIDGATHTYHVCKQIIHETNYEVYAAMYPEHKNYNKYMIDKGYYRVTYGASFYDDKIYSCCKFIVSFGDGEICTKHKCMKTHTTDEIYWHFNGELEKIAVIYTDIDGDCNTEFMKESDPAVYVSPWNPKKIFDSLPEYLENLSQLISSGNENIHEI